MSEHIHIIKGIQPGLYINWHLVRKEISMHDFAQQLNISRNTISDLIDGNAKLSIELASKIEKQLGLKKNTLMFLQQQYENKIQSGNNKKTPNISRLRPALFWDTDIKKIDWEKQKNAVIRRVFDRGNETEKNEVKRFYGIYILSKVNEPNAKLPL